jgi:hypothetical protein
MLMHCFGGGGCLLGWEGMQGSLANHEFATPNAKLVYFPDWVSNLTGMAPTIFLEALEDIQMSERAINAKGQENKVEIK